MSKFKKLNVLERFPRYYIFKRLTNQTDKNGQSNQWANTVIQQLPDEVPDFDTLLKKRKQDAEERERIGIKGELYVYSLEKQKLNEAGRSDLSHKVSLVSSETNLGFDIISFTLDGKPVHIEVKTTLREYSEEDYFYLSENERITASKDPYWAIYRVWNVDSNPRHEVFPGEDICKRENIELFPASWLVKVY